MDDLKDQMQANFLKYASYVILERAIPHVTDGLKPVQRRILQTLQQMDDGKLHKVANVVGQTMALHPHGDAPINEALVSLANRGYLLDRQGNFGNIFTGDPAAAARYIETRLSPLARETLFNKDLTTYFPSYDGRNQEAANLPAKIPLLLLQGAEGIAVGMATKILPHNFTEVIEAEISLLEGRSFTLLPDFPTGGIMDASDYDKGRGRVKLRAALSIPNDKTILIKEICYGTTTESLIKSIDEAAKKGKLKIESIHDFTSDKVEIEIKLPRGQYALQTLEALYAYTDCEITLNTQLLVIKDNLPWETDVDQVLQYHVERLQYYLKRELEIERDSLKERILQKSLEKIFIGERLYKRIEEISSYEEVHATIAASFVPYHDQLLRVPTQEDRERLLNIPIRRISRFDLNRNEEEVREALLSLENVEKKLQQIKKETIHYLKQLLKKYGKFHPRKTKLEELQQIDKKTIATRKIKVAYDPQQGFLGSKVQGEQTIEATNFDKLLLIFNDGSYCITAISEKQFIHQEDRKIIHWGVIDKKQVFCVIYRNKETDEIYGKRFIIDKFILDKNYRYIDENQSLECFTDNSSLVVELNFLPSAKQKIHQRKIAIAEIPIKGVTAKGIRLTDKQNTLTKLI